MLSQATYKVASLRFQRGFSIEEIARRRRCSIQKVEEHLQNWIAKRGEQYP